VTDQRADLEIGGSCDPRFSAVRDAFADNFRSRGEIGAAVAISIEGRPVVDLWGGWTDEGRTRAWQSDTLVDVFSVGKAMVAITTLRLVEAEALDLDAPVIRYWPEFGEHEKDGITTRMLLAHRAGLPAIRTLLPDDAIYDWRLMTSALAGERPWWKPGSRHGYHVNTFGFLLGEVIGRVAGANFEDVFTRQVCEPLGAEFLYGIEPDYDQRIADYMFDSMSPEPIEGDATHSDDRDLLLHRVYLNPPGISGLGTVDGVATVNSRRWRAAVMPSTNGHSNARSVARIFSALACDGTLDGVRVLGRDTIELATTVASAGVDAVLDRPTRFGLGFQLTQPERPLGTNPRSFGHFGAGGSLGFADPDAKLAFAYAMNRAGPRWQNPRNKALVDAAYASL
jgi:CubicO group peptidase (beta-lactamase class C family)